MDTDSQNIFSKYQESKAPEIDYPKALGYLEGTVKNVIQMLQSYQKELDRPEVGRAINYLQDGLNKALEHAPRVKIPSA